ncbi:MAG: adenosylmethionine--8-amino-7-oxononanoate transaminase [Erythrobacter sp.]
MNRSPVWHPFTQHGLGEPIPLVERAEGAHLFTQDGRKVVDAISSWWVTTHGHCYPPIVEAIQKQAGELDQMIFAGWTHEPADRLARELVDILPCNLPYVFYSDSGSTAVEVALKMALGFWANEGSDRHRLIVMENSYHGDTIGTMSIGERGVFNQAYEPMLFEVDSIPFPHQGAEQATLDALELYCANPQAAALIVEPLLLGAGGMLTYSPVVLKEMHAICAMHGVLFIADEVMTGWGRTGTLLACEQAGVSPDIVCLAKGITGGVVPLAATMASTAIYDAHFSKDRTKTFYHSSSFTANPISCAAALANIAVWRDEPVQERIDDLGARQQAGLDMLSALDGIENARRCGTMMAVDFAVGESGYLSQIGPQLLRFFRERDMLVRPLGNTVYLMPPYCITAGDLSAIHTAIGEARAELS